MLDIICCYLYFKKEGRKEKKEYRVYIYVPQCSQHCYSVANSIAKTRKLPKSLPIDKWMDKNDVLCTQ